MEGRHLDEIEFDGSVDISSMKDDGHLLGKRRQARDLQREYARKKTSRDGPGGDRPRNTSAATHNCYATKAKVSLFCRLLAHCSFVSCGTSLRNKEQNDAKSSTFCDWG